MYKSLDLLKEEFGKIVRKIRDKGEILCNIMIDIDQKTEIVKIGMENMINSLTTRIEDGIDLDRENTITAAVITMITMIINMIVTETKRELS